MEWQDWWMFEGFWAFEGLCIYMANNEFGPLLLATQQVDTLQSLISASLLSWKFELLALSG